MLIFSNLIISKLFYLALPIALLQIFVIPGFLVNFFFRFKSNFFTFIVYCLCVSLIFNYCLVLFLTIIGIFNFYVIWTIIIIEFIILFNFKKDISNYIIEIFQNTIDIFKLLINRNLNNKIISYLIIFLCGILIINYLPFIKDRTNGYLQVFELGDVLHYNLNQARSWFDNEVPTSVFLKPQLWYSNVSLIYVIFNNPYFEPFGKLLFILTPFFIFISLIGLSLSSKNLLYLLTGIIGLNLVLTNTYSFSTSGYLEIPQLLGFLIFLNFFYDELINKTNLNNNKYVFYLLIIILLFNFLTKEQSWLIILPLAAYYIFFKNELKNLKISLNLIIKLILLFSVIFFPYYLYNYFFDPAFKDAIREVISLITFDKSFHLRANHDTEFLNIDSRILYAIDKVPDFLLIPTLGLFLTRNKIQNIFTYSFILPYVIIWMLVMSNEIRYLYPLYLIIVMVGYRNILEFAFNLKYKKLLNIKLTFLTIFLLFLFTLIFNKNIKNYSQFLDSISYKKINILNDPDDIKPKFNQKIVDFFKKENLNKNDIILSNYYILPYLNIPALSKINKKIIYSNFENFKNIDKPNYIIVFKNCIDFDTKYKKELDLKKVIIEDNSCIFKKFNQ